MRPRNCVRSPEYEAARGLAAANAIWPVKPPDRQRVVTLPPLMQACHLIPAESKAHHAKTRVQHTAGEFAQPRIANPDGWRMLSKKVKRHAIRIDMQVSTYNAIADTTRD